MTSVGGADTSNVKQAAGYHMKRSTNIEKLYEEEKNTPYLKRGLEKGKKAGPN